MKKFITVLAIIAALFALTTLSACSSKETVEESITFGDDGNIYMSQKLCDEEDPDLSPEMEKKLQQWWDDLGTDKNPNGKVVCTK